MRLFNFRSRRVLPTHLPTNKKKEKIEYISVPELKKYLESLDDNIERSAYSIEKLVNTEILPNHKYANARSSNCSRRNII